MKRVLVIAGSDSGGGAGIQADIKTITSLGAYAATAVTAVTVQDTRKVHDILPVPPEMIRRQIEVVLDDIGADIIKTGMIGSLAAGEAVADALDAVPDIPLVLDPVMVATSGDVLGTPELIALFRERLIPRAMIVTPNMPEAAALTGSNVREPAEQYAAASTLCEWGAAAALVKGGHGGHEMVEDILCTGNGFSVYENPRLETRHTHGTGCTLASALAVRLAERRSLEDATGDAIDYVRAAMETAPGFGNGHGPLNHLVRLREM